MLSKLKSTLSQLTSQSLPPATETDVSNYVEVDGDEGAVKRELVPNSNHDLYLVSERKPAEKDEPSWLEAEPVLFIVVDNGRPTDMVSMSFRMGCLKSYLFNARHLTIGNFGGNIDGWLTGFGWVSEHSPFLGLLKNSGFQLSEKTKRLTTKPEMPEAPFVGDLIDNADGTFSFETFGSNERHDCATPLALYQSARAVINHWKEFDKSAADRNRIKMSDLLLIKFNISDSLIAIPDRDGDIIQRIEVMMARHKHN